jgi:ribosomal protein L9
MTPGENDQLFGSVTSKDIAEALAAQTTISTAADSAGRSHTAISPAPD